MTPRDALRALGIALPVLGVALGIVRAELHLAGARRFVLPIAGVDPRDPISGHYLEYRLVLGTAGTDSVCADDEPGCALCLHAARGDEPSRVERISGAPAPGQCDALVPSAALSTLQRYYIPEARADELTAKLRAAAETDRARIVIMVDASGTARPAALWLAGEVVNAAD